MDHGPDPDLQVVDAIYDALDAGRPDVALRLAEGALAAVEDGTDPVLHFLAGVALFEAGESAEAVPHLERAVELDADDPEFRVHLARALFSICRFEDASDAVDGVLAREPSNPDAHALRGLLLERRGRFDEADRAFADAHRADPETFPLPHRLDEDAFAREVEAAAERLPEPVRAALDEVAVSVEPLPDDATLAGEAEDGSDAFDPELLGLFVGVPRADANPTMAPGHAPARILVFQRNLERCFPEPERLREEIAKTLWHELGHYLGLDEDDLEARDLA